MSFERLLIEWRVCIEQSDHVEIHTFGTEEEARSFEKTLPRPDIHEGGLVWPKPASFLKLVHHPRK